MLGWQERFPQVGDVRGLGAMLAIELVRDPVTKQAAPELATAVVEKAMAQGLLLLKSGLQGNCIRVLVPLVISDAELDEALDVWEGALESLLRLMRQEDETLDLLRKVPLFAACAPDELRQIAAIADELNFREGKILTRQGGPGREMFILLEGKVKVERNGEQINTLGPGDFLGEGALVLGKPRNATITSTSPLRALVISEGNFKQLLGDGRIAGMVHETLAAQNAARRVRLDSQRAAAQGQEGRAPVTRSAVLRLLEEGAATDRDASPTRSTSAPGKTLTQQGAPGREFFVLLEGTVDVVRDGKKISELGAGQFFGELALISNIPRTATVTATSPIRALVVVDRDFRRLLKDDVNVAVKVLGTMAERMPPADTTRLQELRAPLVALEGQVDQPVEELGIRHTGRLEELCVDTRRREAGDRVQLVHEHVAVFAHEAVDARHALAFGGDESAARRRSCTSLICSSAIRGGTIRSMLALVVLRRVVVPVLTREARATTISPGSDASGVLLPSTPHLDLDARTRTLRPAPSRRAVVPARRRGAAPPRPHLGDADGRAETGRLDEDRVVERMLRRVAVA